MEIMTPTIPNGKGGNKNDGTGAFVVSVGLLLAGGAAMATGSLVVGVGVAVIYGGLFGFGKKE